MFSPDINFSPLTNTENIAADINQAGYGPSSPGQISSPDINFFQAENGQPSYTLGIPRQGQVLFLRPAGLEIFPRRDALGLTGKWALKNNKWDVIIKTEQ